MNRDALRALPMGIPVEITHVYRRRFEIRNVPNSGHSQGVLYWARKELPKPEHGVFVGYRTLSDGWIAHGGDGNVWKPLEYRLCALVVTHPRKNPVRVPPPYIWLEGCRVAP